MNTLHIAIPCYKCWAPNIMADRKLEIKINYTVQYFRNLKIQGTVKMLKGIVYRAPPCPRSFIYLPSGVLTDFLSALLYFLWPTSLLRFLFRFSVQMGWAGFKKWLFLYVYVSLCSDMQIIFENARDKSIGCVPCPTIFRVLMQPAEKNQHNILSRRKSC